MNLQEQLREAMAGVEVRPRRNLEGAPEVDTNRMIESLGGKPEAAATETENDDDDSNLQQAEAETTDETEPEAAEGEREPLTMDDLAEALEWKKEALYDVVVPMQGIGGLDSMEPMTLGTLKNWVAENHVKVSSLEANQQELAEREQAIAAHEARLAEQLEMASPPELVRAEAALQRAQDDYNRINWVELETSNPGQAALMRQKLTDQISQATYQRDGIKQNITQLQQDLKAQQAEAQKQYLRQARLELHRLIPSWANEGTFATERESLVQYGIANGIDEATLRSVADPKIIAFLYKSWKRDGKIEEAKPVTKPPKVLKPQAVANRNAGRKANLNKLVDTAKRTRDTRDQTRAVRELLFAKGS